MSDLENSDNNLVKLRVIIVHEYLANPEYYDTSDPKEMCKIDTENWLNYPNDSYESFFSKDDLVKIVVEAPDHGVSYGPLELENKWDI